MPSFAFTMKLATCQIIVRGALEPALELKRLRANRRLKFHKGGQLFIRPHNEALSVVAVCVSNSDRSPVGINR